MQMMTKETYRFIITVTWLRIKTNKAGVGISFRTPLEDLKVRDF